MSNVACNRELAQSHKPVSDRLEKLIQQCMDNFDVGDPAAEWPNNILSRHTTIYSNGVIGQRGEAVQLEVDRRELALCRRLAVQAEKLMAGIEIGMGSESSDEFCGFFMPVVIGELPPKTIDEKLIRSRFGGNIFPHATITVEPLAEQESWWDEVAADLDFETKREKENYLRPWRKMIRWFQLCPQFVSRAFIRIGSDENMWDVWETKELPEGSELTPSTFPRMALGLTKNGSLVGLFSICVNT
ncbi:MAG: hypothetical protein C5B47_01650 [Verrucomicrobia bacterium]|nr:MAG: hypothetical protein C5B47_01650 [Verrucomicrobiota bacterium]